MKSYIIISRTQPSEADRFLKIDLGYDIPEEGVQNYYLRKNQPNIKVSIPELLDDHRGSILEEFPHYSGGSKMHIEDISKETTRESMSEKGKKSLAEILEKLDDPKVLSTFVVSEISKEKYSI